MRSDTTQGLPIWETPDMTVVPINEATLGLWDFGSDFDGEISA